MLTTRQLRKLVGIQFHLIFQLNHWKQGEKLLSMIILKIDASADEDKLVEAVESLCGAIDDSSVLSLLWTL